MLRPEDNRVESQLLSLLNSPAMLHRGGNPFGMDRSRNSLAGVTMFPSNKLSLSSLGLGGISAVNQYPPQRLQASFHQANSCLMSPLEMLSERVTGEKRTTTFDLRGPEAKRQKLSPSPPNVLQDNPKLLERLTSLSGGFPGPKWGATKKTNDSETASLEQAKKTSQRGAFPLPSLGDGRTKDLSKISLKSYQELWKDTDIDLREEVLARKLERSNCRISQRKFMSLQGDKPANNFVQREIERRA